MKVVEKHVSLHGWQHGLAVPFVDSYLPVFLPKNWRWNEILKMKTEIMIVEIWIAYDQLSEIIEKIEKLHLSQNDYDTNDYFVLKFS